MTADDLRAAARDLLIMNHVDCDLGPQSHSKHPVSVESVTTGKRRRPASRPGERATPKPWVKARIVAVSRSHRIPPTVDRFAGTLSLPVSRWPPAPSTPSSFPAVR